MSVRHQCESLRDGEKTERKIEKPKNIAALGREKQAAKEGRCFSFSGLQMQRLSMVVVNQRTS